MTCDLPFSKVIVGARQSVAYIRFYLFESKTCVKTEVQKIEVSSMYMFVAHLNMLKM